MPSLPSSRTILGSSGERSRFEEWLVDDENEVKDIKYENDVKDIKFENDVKDIKFENEVKDIKYDEGGFTIVQHQYTTLGSSGERSRFEAWRDESWC